MRWFLVLFLHIYPMSLMFQIFFKSVVKMALCFDSNNAKNRHLSFLIKKQVGLIWFILKTLKMEFGNHSFTLPVGNAYLCIVFIEATFIYKCFRSTTSCLFKIYDSTSHQSPHKYPSPLIYLASSNVSFENSFQRSQSLASFIPFLYFFISHMWWDHLFHLILF